MPQPSSSNRTQVAWKLEGTYPTNFGVLQAGNGNLVGFTGESLDYKVDSEESKQIRADRGTTDLVLTGADSGGSLEIEFQFKEYDEFLAALLQNSWTHYGTNGVSAAANLTIASSTSITNASAWAGNDSWANLQKGQWIKVIPPAGASQTIKDYLSSRLFRLSPTVAPTGTAITLDTSTPINTSIITGAQTGVQIASSRLVNGTAMKTYTLEVGHLDINQYRQYTGQSPSKLNLKIGSKGIITGSFEFMGKGFSLVQASGMGTPVASAGYTPMNSTKGIFDIYEGGTQLSATTYLKSLDLTYDNSIRGQDAAGTLGNIGLGAGTIRISGSMQVYFTDAVLYNKFLNNTVTDLTIPIIDPSGNGYVIYLPRVKYKAAKVAVGGQDQDNMLDMEISGLVDTVAGSFSLNSMIVIYRCGV